MIKFIKDKNKLVVYGHAMYDKIGKDIVCASVSTLLISNTNLLTSLDQEQNYKYKIIQSPAQFTLELIKPNEINKAIFKNIIYYLSELEKDYPNNIKEEK